MENLAGKRIGFAVTGSFCTFKKTFEAAQRLVDLGAELLPIMSENSCTIDTRFGTAADQMALFEKIAGRSIIRTIADAEPIGPKKMCDVMLVSPCTGNTLAKLANSITDTSVTMAVKSHLRTGRPVVIAISTNDALAGTAQNWGKLLNVKHYHFVPAEQDDAINKPNSLVANFDLIPETLITVLTAPDKA